MYEGKHIHFSEVDNKPLCSYSPKLCKQRRLNGYAFCIRHVLEDRTAPFKQCEYVAKYNSQRCTNPIPKSEDRRYCNSHLQVLGFKPKKERKKKQDVLEEMRSRPHLESVALNVVVPCPPLALKTPNGLEAFPACLPCLPRGHLLPISQTELQDPFHEDEMDSEDGSQQKGSVFKMNQEGELELSQKLQLNDTDLLNSPTEHFSISSLPFPHPPSSSPLHYLRAAQQPGLLPWPPNSHQTFSSIAAPQQGRLCKPSPPRVRLLPTSSGTQSREQATGPALSQNALPTYPSPVPSAQQGMVVLRSTTFLPPVTCLARLKRLVQLCAQQQEHHGDLFPHLGLDWSEDSAEDEDEEMDRVPLSDEEVGDSRRTRLARLCSYLQQKYKHLCQQERAAVRQRRYHYAFRKALLHAASRDPHCAGQLLEELGRASQARPSTPPPVKQDVEPGHCAGSTRGQACSGRVLPFTRHCFQHILLNRSQQLFSSCTARFADGQQCSIPVFDITHQTPLCEEHAKKMDNFLRGDNHRRLQHQHQQQQCRPRKKTKQPALTKKHKKKRKRGSRRPQKPIPPALPQGNLAVPSCLILPAQVAGIRSPSTADLSAEELPDDITSDITDIPNDLELNQEDFSDVLPRLPDDLQDFDLFEGKNGDLLPTTEEAEELVRALQAMGSYTESLVCLGPIGDLGQPDTVDHRTMSVFSNPGNFSNLELDDNLLESAGASFPSSPPSPQAEPPVTASSASTQEVLVERTFRPRTSHLLNKLEISHSSPHSNHYGSEHVPSPYSDHMSSPHPSSFQTEPPLLLEVPLNGLPCPSRSPWNHLPLSLTDPGQFGNLVGPEGHLMSTSLSTPPSSVHSITLGPTAALSVTNLPVPLASTSSSSLHNLLTSTQPKLQLPQFSAVFGHQLASHSGIPKDVHPNQSSTAPPSSFSIASAVAAGASGSVPPFTTQ
ncbi:INO80 complex subunit D-like [Scleropages formosus]|uniref:INO80 complex subunit D-like n=1 Tax=Scleropages formosus TaxID=113540 RepID=A0A0P7XTC1_SCLFO|nr:INO80 complex subunit D-like [Scleropages formosus]